ncbi:AMP-binding protein [Streptomyces sp. PmtG]
MAARCADGADDTALLCLDDTGEATGHTYRDLDARARTVAAALLGHVAPGTPVLVVTDSGPHAVAALLGCLYAGAVPVPVPPPDASHAAAERTAAIAADTDAPLLLTDSTHAPRNSPGGSPTRAAPAWSASPSTASRTTRRPAGRLTPGAHPSSPARTPP